MTTTLRPALRAHGVSDAGRVRTANEDAFVADAEHGFFAVADGMGGHAGGGVASRVAIEAMTEFIHRSGEDEDCPWPYGTDAALSLDGNRLRTAIRLANGRVFRVGESQEEYRGMGTTIVSVLATNGSIAVGHVGDSRLYVVSDGHIAQVTRDDSWAATVLVTELKLAPDAVARHPMRNVLTHALGTHEQVDIHLNERDIHPGDIMLLCSDGVHGVLNEDAIRTALLRTRDVEQSAHAVIRAALDGGSRDNVTALVVRYEGAAA